MTTAQIIPIDKEAQRKATASIVEVNLNNYAAYKAPNMSDFARYKLIIDQWQPEDWHDFNAAKYASYKLIVLMMAHLGSKADTKEVLTKFPELAAHLVPVEKKIPILIHKMVGNFKSAGQGHVIAAVMNTMQKFLTSYIVAFETYEAAHEAAAQIENSDGGITLEKSKYFKEALVKLSDHIFETALEFYQNPVTIEIHERLFNRHNQDVEPNQLIIDRFGEYNSLLINGGRAFVLIDKIKEAEITNKLIEKDMELFKILDRSSASAYYANAPIYEYTPSGQEKTLDIVNEWIASPDRVTLDGLTFDPKTNERISKGRFNTWSGWIVEPEQSDDALIFWDLLFTGLCNGNEDYFKYVRKWLAHMVQRPWEQPLTAIGISGKQGNGKSAFAQVIGSLMHPVHYNPTIRLEDATGKFTSGIANKLLIVFDDQTWGGDVSAQGQMKRLITSDQDRIELKGKDAEQLPSFKRVIFNSNSGFYYKADSDDRRLLPLEPDNKVINKNNEKFWDEFWDKLRNGKMKEGVMYDLMNENIKSFNPFKDLAALEITTGAVMQEHSMSSVELWLKQSLNDCFFALSDDVRARAPKGKISKKALRNSYEYFCSQSSFHKTRMQNLDSVEHRELMIEVLGEPKTVRVNSGAVPGRQFDWMKARDKFLAKQRFKFKWDNTPHTDLDDDSEY